MSCCENYGWVVGQATNSGGKKRPGVINDPLVKGGINPNPGW